MPDNDTGTANTGAISNNMRIWDQVHEVPNEFTKGFTRNGDELTAIAPVWYLEVMTEMFGPVGEGWGFEIIKDGFVKDAKGHPVLHGIEVEVWWWPTGKPESACAVTKATARGVGCTRMQYRDSDGVDHWDDDFNKKTLTDAITNALSRLGFGADIRKRSYEGSKYVGPAGAQIETDVEMVAAWNEYILWARKQYPELAETMSNMDICFRAAKKLTDHQRQITPDNVRGLIMKEPS